MRTRPSILLTRALLVSLVTAPVGVVTMTPTAAAATTATASASAVASERPTILVHGFRGSSLDFDTIRVRFEAAGYPADRIHAVDFARPMTGSNRENAKALARTVSEVLARAKTDQVNIVAHSMGNLSTRYYLKYLGGATRVHTYVSIGAMHAGLPEDKLASPCKVPAGFIASLDELCGSRSFIASLNVGDKTPGSTRYVSIYSVDDELVPVPSATLEGAINFAVEGPAHAGRFGLLEDRGVFEILFPYVSR